MSSAQGLSDSEIESLLARPRVTKDEVFGPAEKWFASLREKFVSNHPGKTLLLNADDFTFVIGEDFKHAMDEYKKMFDPMPPSGWWIYSVKLMPQ